MLLNGKEFTEGEEGKFLSVPIVGDDCSVCKVWGESFIDKDPRMNCIDVIESCKADFVFMIFH